MRLFIRNFYFACLLCAASSSALNAENFKAFPKELEADLSAGATAVYHLEFETAEKHLRHAIMLRPDHPSAYFFMTMLRWYELTYDSLEYRNPHLEKVLEDQANETIKISKKFVKNADSQATAYLYMGGALGAKGWYHVTRGQWVRAYFAGKKGYAFVKKAADLDPELYDAYLGIGMYEYYAATLGPTLRALASFSIRGDKENAIKILKLVEHKGKYVRFESSYFLWNSALEEGRLEDAAAKAESLVQSFPDSPLYKWCEIQTLFYQKKWPEVIRKCQEFIDRALGVSNSKNFSHSFKLLLPKVYYHCGAAYYNVGQLRTAQDYFERAIARNGPFTGWRAMGYIRKGELLDLEGKRDHAVECYKKALEFPKVWNSYKLAKERIKKPFRSEDLAARSELLSPLESWRAETSN